MLTLEPLELGGEMPLEPLEPEAVIREARRRQRRRWLLYAAALFLAGSLVAGSVVAAGSSPPAGTHARGSARHGPASYAAGSLTHHVPVPFGSAAACPATPTGSTVTASARGTFTGCLRVGTVGAGTYHVVVSGYLTVPRSTGRGMAPAATRVHLAITPSRGGPGTRVTVTATLPAPSKSTTTYGVVCWDGCADGLQFDTTKHWTSSTTFVERFRVPAAPWVVAARHGEYAVHALMSGKYRVGVDCIVVSKGCGAQTAGSALFHLVVPRSDRRHECTSLTPETCVYLQLRRVSALPGQAVLVRGFAPLTSNLLNLELVRGNARGPAVAVQHQPKGGSTLRLGQADLAVRAAPAFSSLGRLTVLGEQTDGPAPVSANPDVPDRVAWCGLDAIGLADASGAATGSVPTSGVPSALAGAGIGYGLTPATVVCDDVALPAAGPAVLAAFSVAVEPTRTVAANVALETTDGGARWSLVPAPAGARVTGFGGFRYVAGHVVALYVPSGAQSRYAAKASLPLAETFDTTTGTWTASALQCGAQGQPCTTFGATQPSNCAMNGSIQSIFSSVDGGRFWLNPSWPSNVNACAAASLVATGASSELLVDASAPYPLLRSTDGGHAWSDVALPRTPFTPGGSGAGVTMLPGGSLLTIQPGVSSDWMLLPAGHSRWCPVTSVPATVRETAGGSHFALFDTALWWVSGGTGGALPTTLGRVPVSTIRC